MQVLRQVDPRTELFPFAAPDYATGGRLAARHLIAQGARRIAFVGGLADRPVTRERMTGYLETLAEAGAAPLVFPGRPARAFGRAAAPALLEAGVDAALCFSDLVALGLQAGLQAQGARVGADVRLVGFDDIEEAALAHPQLTSVHCGVAGFGRDAAATMLRWLDTGAPPPPVRRPPVELIIRQSSGGLERTFISMH